MTFELWQNGVMVAAVDAPTREKGFREIMHYARQYAEDGPVELKIIGRPATPEAGEG